MKASSIVNRIKEVLATYTEAFSNIKDIASITCAGTTATATSTNHGLTTNDNVTITGAKKVLGITSLTRSGNVVTAICSNSHDLIDPSQYSAQWLPLKVEITSAAPAEYNGIFELISVVNDTTFTYKITTTPVSPATTAGRLFQDDMGQLNGYKKVTVIDANTFTYDLTQAASYSTAGDIKMSVATKVSGVASPLNIVDYYNLNGDGILDDRLFVCVQDDSANRNRTTADSIESQQNSNLEYFYTIQQNFDVFVVTSSRNDLQGAYAADRARSYRKPLLKAIANFQFDNDLTDNKYQPAFYLGSSAEVEASMKAFAIHKFDFQAIAYIQNSDVNQDRDSVLLKEIDVIEKSSNLEVKADF